MVRQLARVSIMLPLITSLTHYLVSGLAILLVLLVEIMEVGKDFRELGEEFCLVLLWLLFDISFG